MCDSRELMPIPAFLFSSGGVTDFDPEHPEFAINDAGEKCLVIDTCMAFAVAALWKAGITTISCCCGHGDAPSGVITVKPGLPAGALLKAMLSMPTPLVDLFAEPRS
jgi:hypothetical protein